MLPSVEAFLALWDNPVEFVKLEVASLGGEFRVEIVIEAPNNPVLKIKMDSMKTGEA